MNALPIYLSISALSIGTALAAVNIIDVTHGEGAGSFELGNYVRTGALGNHMHLNATSTTMTGWVVGGAQGVDWMTTPDNAAYEGAYSVDLSGVSTVPSIGSVTTTIPTAVGVTYLISFYAYGGVEPLPGRLIAGTLDQTFMAPGNPNPQIASFARFEYSFTALDSQTSITFSSTPISYGFGPAIDDVVVAIPEVSSSLVATLGIGLLSLRRRRIQRI
jgi:hypothetical protein